MSNENNDPSDVERIVGDTRHKNQKIPFKMEIRNGYLWMSRVPVLRKIMDSPGRSFSSGGDAAHAWQEFIDWMRPKKSADQPNLPIVKIYESRLSEMMDVSRQALHAYNKLPVEQKSDATSHRNLLFLATRTPPMPFDHEESPTIKDAMPFIKKGMELEQIMAAWKARQLIEKYKLPKDSMVNDAEIAFDLTHREEERVEQKKVKTKTETKPKTPIQTHSEVIVMDKQNSAEIVTVSKKTKSTLYALRMPQVMRDYLEILRVNMQIRNMSELITLLITAAMDKKPWEKAGWAWLAPRSAMLKREGMEISQVNINIFNPDLVNKIEEIRNEQYLSANSVLMSLLINTIEEEFKNIPKANDDALRASLGAMQSQVYAHIDENYFPAPQKNTN